MGGISQTFQYNALCVSKCFLNSLAHTILMIVMVGGQVSTCFFKLHCSQLQTQIDRDNGKIIDWLVSNSGECQQKAQSLIFKPFAIYI